MSDWTRAVEDRAIDWLIRQRDGRFDDWEAFEAWLASDESHAHAYARMAADDRDLGDMLDGAVWPVGVEPANDRGPARRYWLSGAVAASLALALGVWTILPSRDLYSVQTAGGERRIVALADSKVELNGDTRIVLDRKDGRYAELDHGQAMFDVTHDAARPFKVKSGGMTLVDVGTSFEVTSDEAGFDLAVSEGKVVVDPGSADIGVPAGNRFVVAKGERKGQVRPIKPSEVGGWRTGQLYYDGASLARLAADLQRNLGVRVRVDDTLARRSFRGVVRLDGGADATMQRVSVLLGVAVRRVGNGWMIAGP